MSQGPAVRIADLRFVWPAKDRFAVEMDDFSIAHGERVLLLGPSGSGKSTVLSLLAGIISPARGIIEIAGTDIARMRPVARDRFRANNIGLIFQSLNLIPYLSTVENTVLPLHFAPERRRRVASEGGIDSAAYEILRRLGLPPETFGSMPAKSLSVGQQQRVAVARSLIGEPGLLIADEPTSALDFDHREAFLSVVGEQLQNSNTAMIMVSHDRSLSSFFDRTVDLTDMVTTERGR